MKTLFVTFTFAVLCGQSFSQVPSTTYPNNSSTYPNSSMPASPGTPAVQPYDGTNPSGQNNVINPEPTQPVNTYPNTTPATPVPAPTPQSTYPSNPANPGLPNTSPPGVPNSVTPALPPNNSFNRLFQDPTRTPSEPQRHDPVRTVDGSTGKYKNDHKIHTGKNFAANSHHLKKAKQHDNGKEGSTEKNTPVVR